jgi:hypothetical protein
LKQFVLFESGGFLREEFGMQNLRTVETLQSVKCSPFDHSGDLPDHAFADQRFNASGPEFMALARFQDNLSASEDQARVKILSGHQRITSRLGLDVHGYVVYQIRLEEFSQHSGSASVRVQFEEVTHTLDFFAKKREVIP